MLAGTVQSIDLMLLPKNGDLQLSRCAVAHAQADSSQLCRPPGTWRRGRQCRSGPVLAAHGNAARSLASFFNLATAMSAINLPVGTPLDYIKEVIWDNTFAQDRFFGYADPKIIDQIMLATLQGEFAPELDPSIFHGTATRSWKQIQFGEANVQLTFHENDPTKQIDGINCVKIEPDIDYYKDLGAHFLLEVVGEWGHPLADRSETGLCAPLDGRPARGGAGFQSPVRDCLGARDGAYSLYQGRRLAGNGPRIAARRLRFVENCRS